MEHVARTRREALGALGTTAVTLGAGCQGVVPGGSDETTDSEGTTDGTESTPSITGTWPQLRHDAARTGSTDAEPPSEDVEVAWTEGCDVVPEWFVVADGATYHDCFPDLVARDGASGDEEWTETDRAVAAPVVDDGTAYAVEYVEANDDGTELETRVVAFDAATGEAAWHVVDDRGGSAALAFADGHLYHAAEGTMSKISVASQERVWQYDVDGSLAAPAVRDGTAYVAQGGAAVVDAVNADGSRRWRTDLDVTAVAGPVLGETLTYVGALDEMYALDAATGDVAWSAPVPQNVSYRPALADDTLVASGRDVHAVDATTGDERWRTSLAGTPTTEPTVAGDLAVVGDATGTVTALDVETGDTAWTVAPDPESDGQVMWGPVAVDDTVLVSTEYGDVHRLAGGESAAP